MSKEENLVIKKSTQGVNYAYVPSTILILYKQLKASLKATEIMINVLSDKLTYASVAIDKDKCLQIQAQIKGYTSYYKRLKKHWLSLYKLIDEKCFGLLSQSEQIVFVEGFMNNLTEEQIAEKYPSMSPEYIGKLSRVISKRIADLQGDYFQ